MEPIYDSNYPAGVVGQRITIYMHEGTIHSVHDNVPVGDDGLTGLEIGVMYREEKEGDPFFHTFTYWEREKRERLLKDFEINDFSELQDRDIYVLENRNHFYGITIR